MVGSSLAQTTKVITARTMMACRRRRRRASTNAAHAKNGMTATCIFDSVCAKRSSGGWSPKY